MMKKSIQDIVILAILILWCEGVVGLRLAAETPPPNSATFAPATAEAVTDSTRILYPTTASIDSAFARLLTYYQTDPSKARQELRRLKSLADHLHYSEGIIRYFQTAKEVAELVSFEAELLKELNTALSNPRYSFSDTQINKLRLLEAIIHYSLQNYDRSLQILSESDERLFNSSELGSLHATRGFIYQSKGEFAPAISSLQKSLRYYREAGDTKNEILVLSTLAENLEINGRYDESLRYYNEALELLAPPYLGTRLAYQIYSGMGILYRYMEQLDLAIEYQNKALDLARALGSTDFVAQTLLNIGNVYNRNHDYELALSSFRESEKISRQEGIGYGIYLNSISIANVLRILDRLEESVAAYDTALVYAEMYDQPLDKVRLYQGISEVHRALGNHKEQAVYLQKYVELREDLFDSEVDDAIEDLRVQFETEKKNQEIALKQSELDRSQAEKKLILSGSVFGLMVFIFAGIGFVYRNRALKHLYERNLELLNHYLPPKTEEVSNDVDPDGRFLKIYEQIKELFEKEHLYKKDDLTVADISQKLGVNHKYVSKAITLYTKKTFNHHSNFYRITEARRCIKQQGANAHIKEIMYDCGFRSRSTFNVAFKEFTGMTPSQFKSRVQS